MKVCVIVDGYKFSKDYVALISSKDYGCIHVQSTPHLVYKASTYNKNDYVENYVFDKNLESLINKLSQYDIKCVIPGVECGVELADLLANHFQTPRNNLAKSPARRNKYLMTEALREKGVATVKYHKTSDYSAALQWIEKNTTWPVVAKPLSSSGSEDVYICQSTAELNNAFTTIKNNKNVMCEQNREVLIQAFLEGTEYVVNSVSCQGKHYISDLWQCEKQLTKDQRIIYDTEQLLPYDGEAQNLLTDYIKSVLDALDIQYGAGHAEVMMTKEGPILIEIGARIGGHTWFSAHQHCMNHNQIELTVDSYLDPHAFFEKTAIPFQMKKHTLLVLLASTQSGIIEAMPIVEKAKQLESFLEANMAVKVGDRLEITKDLLTSPGKIILAHEDPSVIHRDYVLLKSLEKKGFTLR